MTLDDFLDKLEGVRPAGNGYVAICPGHEDDSPSLGVTEAEDGRLLLRCHAGCETEDVLKAMGLTFRDLGKNRGGTGTPEATYQYVDEEGNLLFEVVRFPGKDFRQRRPDGDGGWIWKLEDTRRVLYQLPEVLKGKAEGRTIYVVEGEKDVETIRSLGRVATCPPGGAGKWRDEYVESLAGAGTVIVVADRDDPGRAHAARVRETLLGRVDNIHVLQAAKGKDVTDHVLAGLPLEKLIPIRQGPRRGLITSRDLADAGLELLTLDQRDMPGYTPIENLPVTYRGGRVYLLGGYTADGKSSFAAQKVRTLAEAGVKLGVFTNEMSESDYRNKLVAHKGIPLTYTENPWRLREDPVMRQRYVDAIEEISEWDMDIVFDTALTADKIAQHARAREHDFVIIDHVHRFGWGTERRALEAEMLKLTNLALEMNIPLLVVAQLRRFERGKGMVAFPRPTAQDFRETAILEQESSMALAVWRQRAENGMTLTGHNEFIILKNRHTTSPQDATGRIYHYRYDLTSQWATFGGLHAPAEVSEVEEEAVVDDWSPA